MCVDEDPVSRSTLNIALVELPWPVAPASLHDKSRFVSVSETAYSQKRVVLFTKDLTLYKYLSRPAQ